MTSSRDREFFGAVPAFQEAADPGRCRPSYITSARAPPRCPRERSSSAGPELVQRTPGRTGNSRRSDHRPHFQDIEMLSHRVATPAEHGTRWSHRHQPRSSSRPPTGWSTSARGRRRRRPHPGRRHAGNGRQTQGQPYRPLPQTAARKTLRRAHGTQRHRLAD